MSIDVARAVAALLERVAKGAMSAPQALSEWPQSSEEDPLLEASRHDLSHFAADEDIRAKDERYAKYQIELLLDRVQQLRTKFNF